MTKYKFSKFLSGCFVALLLIHPAFAQQLAALTAKANEPAKTTPAAKKPVDPAELEKTVNILEERIRQLEEKLAKLSTAETSKATLPANPSSIAAATVALPQDDLKKEVATLKEEVKKNEGFLGFLKEVEVSGVVDGYYSYNNNKVDLFTQGRAFDVRHNAFSLQMGKISLEKKNSVDSPLGFRVDLAAGETVDRIISVSDSSRNDATKHVLQAYGSYVAPGGLTIDFGKFYTPIGAEVVDTKDNFNYSRGWLFTYGPYYHMGLRAKYAFNDKVAVSGFLVNGWDNVFENNVKAGKTVGVQLGWLQPRDLRSRKRSWLARKRRSPMSRRFPRGITGGKPLTPSPAFTSPINSPCWAIWFMDAMGIIQASAAIGQALLALSNMPSQTSWHSRHALKCCATKMDCARARRKP